VKASPPLRKQIEAIASFKRDSLQKLSNVMATEWDAVTANQTGQAKITIDRQAFARFF